MARAARHALLGTLAFVSVLLVNPFGISEWGDRRSRELWQQVYAPHYGAAPMANTARDAITVIALNKASMESLAPADTQPDSLHLLDVFRTVNNDKEAGGSDVHPRAIFLDLLLGDFAPDEVTQKELVDFVRHGTGCPAPLNGAITYTLKGEASPFRCMLQGIAEITRYKNWSANPACVKASPVERLKCIVAAGGTPVLIAEATDPGDPKATSLSAGQAALAAVAISVPIMIKPPIYPMVYPENASARANLPYTVSPAPLLYAAYCGGLKESESAICVSPIEHPKPTSSTRWEQSYWGWAEAFQVPLEVVWGIGGPDHFTDELDSIRGGTMAANCAIADGSGGGTALALLRAFFGGLKTDPVGQCLYQHTMSFADLRLARREKATLPASALENRIVLVGMSTTDSNDFVEAGPLQQVPGVYFHAMALDNLILHGSNYPKPPRPLIPNLAFSDQDLANSVGAFFMLIFGAVVVALDREDREARRHHPIWRIALRALFWAAATLVWMGLVVFLMTRQIPLMPDRFNIAALAIVLVLQTLNILRTLGEPILERLAVRFRWLGVMLGYPRDQRSVEALAT